MYLNGFTPQHAEQALTPTLKFAIMNYVVFSNLGSCEQLPGGLHTSSIRLFFFFPGLGQICFALALS